MRFAYGWQNVSIQSGCYTRAKNLGIPIVEVHMLDMWHRNNNVQNYGWPYPGIPSGAWTVWHNEVVSMCTWAINNNANVEWEIWNEPDNGGFWGGTQQQFFECWKGTYGIINFMYAASGKPMPVTVGPSIMDQDGSLLRNFLLYARDNSCLPAKVSAHILDGWTHNGSTFVPAPQGNGMVQWANNLRSWMGTNGIGSNRPIVINEFGTSGDYVWAGAIMHYLANLEKMNVDSACRTGWIGGVDDQGNLASMLTPSPSFARCSSWWSMKRHNDVAGFRVASSGSHNDLNGVASINALGSKIHIAGGKATIANDPADTVAVKLTNLSNSKANVLGPYSNRIVKIYAERIPNTGFSALSAPAVIINNQVVNISNQNEYTIQLPNIGPKDAYYVEVIKN